MLPVNQTQVDRQEPKEERFSQSWEAPKGVSFCTFISPMSTTASTRNPVIDSAKESRSKLPRRSNNATYVI